MIFQSANPDVGRRVRSALLPPVSREDARGETAGGEPQTPDEMPRI